MSETSTVENVVIDTDKAASVFDRMFEKAPEINIDLNGNTHTDTTQLPVVPKEETNVEPVKVEVKKETPVVAADEPPETLPNEGRNEIWKKFRTAHKETIKSLSEAKAQLTDFDGTKKERDELKTRIADLEKEREGLKQVDSIARLENDPDFQSKYVTSRDRAVASLKEQAGYGDIEPSELLSAISKTGKDRVTALEGILSLAPSIVKTKIIGLIDQIDGIDIGRTEELKNAQEALSKRVTEREREQSKKREEFEQHAQTVFKQTSESLAKELGVDEATIDKARKFFTSNGDLKLASEIIIKGMFADALTTKDKEKAAKIAELESELKKFRESSPGIASGSNSNLSPIKDDDDFLTAIRKGAKEVKIF